MGQLKPPSQKAAAKAVAATPATAKVPAPAPAKPAGVAPPPPVRKAVPAQPAAAQPAPEEPAPVQEEPRRYGAPSPFGGGITWAGALRESEGPVVVASPYAGYSAEAELERTRKESKESTKRLLRPYLEKLDTVQKLRSEGKIGPRTDFSLGQGAITSTGRTPKFASAVPEEMVLSGRATRKTEPPVFLAAPSKEELDIRAKGAERARQIGEMYRAARGDFSEAYRAAQGVVDDPYASGVERAAAEDDALKKLQRVATLRASLREYGWVDDKEVEEKFGQ